MLTLVFVLLAILALLLTIWMVAIPAGVVAGAFKAFSRGDHGSEIWRRH